PPPQEGRLPPPLDHPHQRRRAVAPAFLQPPHERTAPRRSRDQPQGAGRPRGARSRGVPAAGGGREAGTLTMRDLLAALTELRERLQEIPQADERRLQDLKTEILGRKAGALTQILAALPRLEPAAKKQVGGAANALKQEFEAAFAARERDLKRPPGAAPPAGALPAARARGDPRPGVPPRPVRRVALASVRADRGPRRGRGD